MQKHSVNLLLSSILILVFPLLLAAQAPKSAVVKLKAADGTCATAFFTDSQTVITSAHFIRSSCPQADCTSLQLITAESNPTKANLRLEALYNELDVAKLVLTADAWPTHLDATHLLPPAVNQEIKILHYPACDEFEETPGLVTSSGALDFTANANIKYGSSGGAVIDRDGVVIGVVSQAANVFGALRSNLIGGAFEAQATRFDVISSALRDSSLIPQILLSWYQSDISKIVGFQRLYAGRRFVRAVERLRARLISNGEYSPGLLLANDYPDSFFNLPKAEFFSPQTLELEELGFAASLERHGPFDSAMKTLDMGTLENALQNSGRNSAHIGDLRKMVVRLWEQKYPGAELMVETLVVSAVVLLFILSALWGWSLARVYSLSNGSLAHKIFNVILVGVLLWPLSWLLFSLRVDRASKAKL